MEEQEKKLALTTIANLIGRLNLLKQYLENDEIMNAQNELIPLQIRFDILKGTFN